MIRTELTAFAKDIDTVKPHPDNVRQGDIGALAESLKAHGQYAPIIVQRKTGIIVKGNHTWQAAKSLGWDKIAVVELDLNARQAHELLLIDNRTSDQADYDQAALADLLAKMANATQGLEGTGYTGDDLDDLLAGLQESFVPPTPAAPPPVTSVNHDLTVNRNQSIDSYLGNYQAGSIRGIHLDYPLGVFAWMVEGLSELRTMYGVDNNAEAVEIMLAEKLDKPRAGNE